MALASLLVVIFLTKEIASGIGTTEPSYPSQVTSTASLTMGTQAELATKKEKPVIMGSSMPPSPAKPE
jgi:hypothetical protein